jgi:hypothetical protein
MAPGSRPAAKRARQPDRSARVARRALRTTPRTGTACETACAGRDSASFITATSTGMTAAEASVPGAQTCEQM